mmetsp:Transcript_16445/g.33892  ORF Transcript_16445/g.33892 Transcript_16445/m.33892 type:complete len:216 (-) Transcript_16445:407-1054(-)
MRNGRAGQGTYQDHGGGAFTVDATFTEITALDRYDIAALTHTVVATAERGASVGVRCGPPPLPTCTPLDQNSVYSILHLLDLEHGVDERGGRRVLLAVATRDPGHGRGIGKTDPINVHARALYRGRGIRVTGTGRTPNYRVQPHLSKSTIENSHKRFATCRLCGVNTLNLKRRVRRTPPTVSDDGKVNLSELVSRRSSRGVPRYRRNVHSWRIVI